MDAVYEIRDLSRIAFGLAGSGAAAWLNFRGTSTTRYAHTAWAQVPWPDYISRGKGVRVATMNADSDPLSELLVGLEQGGGGWFAVLDDKEQGFALLRWIRVPWDAYNAANGETRPAAAQLDDDPGAEIVVGLGRGAGGWFATFDDETTGFRFLRWQRVSWPTYNAVNGSTRPIALTAGRIAVALGQGSNGWIEILRRQTDGGYAHSSWLQVPWADYNARNGETFLAAGYLDIRRPGPDLVAGLGTGGGGWLYVFYGFSEGFVGGRWLRTSWRAYNEDPGAGETHPAVGDIDGPDGPEIVIGLGPYAGAGGWFEILDDPKSGFASLGWRNVGWKQFHDAGGALFPVLGTFGH